MAFTSMERNFKSHELVFIFVIFAYYVIMFVNHFHSARADRSIKMVHCQQRRAGEMPGNVTLC